MIIATKTAGVETILPAPHVVISSLAPSDLHPSIPTQNHDDHFSIITAGFKLIMIIATKIVGVENSLPASHIVISS